MNNFSKIVSHFFSLSTLLLFAIIPFHFSGIMRYALILFFTSYVLDYIINKRYLELLKWNWEKFPFILCILLFLTLLFYYPLETDKELWGMLTENRLPLLAFGLLGVLGFKPNIKVESIAATFVIVGVGMTIYALTLVNFIDLIHGDSLTLFDLNFIRHKKIAAHMAYNLYLNVSLLSCIWLIKYKKSLCIKILSTIAYIWIYAMIAITDGRIGILCSNIILLISVVILVPHGYKKWILLTVPVALTVMAFVFVNNDKYRMMAENDASDPRYIIWEECWGMIQKNPWKGNGAGMTIQEIRQDFAAHPVLSKDEFLMDCVIHQDAIGAHPHSQLLQSWMDFGIWGLLITFVLLASPFFILWNTRRNLFSITIWLLIVVQLQTDVIRGSMGYIAFGAYLLLVMNLKSLIDSSEEKDRSKTLCR